MAGVCVAASQESTDLDGHPHRFGGDTRTGGACG